MSIQNPQAFLDNMWDWSNISDIMQMSDIDGICEYNGQFLVIEGKKFGTGIKVGQQRLFDALATHEEFTVLVVWGMNSIPQRAQIRRNGECSRIFDCGMEEYRKILVKWRIEAEKVGR